jgi:hypothetical protein
MPENKRFCLVLDLKDDQKLIAEHEHWHKYAAAKMNGDERIFSLCPGKNKAL